MTDETCSEHEWGPLEVVGGYGFRNLDDSFSTGEIRGYRCKRCNVTMKLPEDEKAQAKALAVFLKKRQA